jgi:hypothetical protein
MSIAFSLNFTIEITTLKCYWWRILFASRYTPSHFQGEVTSSNQQAANYTLTHESTMLSFEDAE